MGVAWEESFGVVAAAMSWAAGGGAVEEEVYLETMAGSRRSSSYTSRAISQHNKYPGSLFRLLL